MSDKKGVVSATTPQGSKVTLSGDLAEKLGWSTGKSAPAKKAPAKKSASSKSKK